jgi:tellurite resistance protein TerA
MSFKITNGETVTLQLNNADNNSVFCAAASFINNNGELILRKEERYFMGHAKADEYYQFGFRWVAGSK